MWYKGNNIKFFFFFIIYLKHIVTMKPHLSIKVDHYRTRISLTTYTIVGHPSTDHSSTILEIKALSDQTEK